MAAYGSARAARRCHYRRLDEYEYEYVRLFATRRPCPAALCAAARRSAARPHVSTPVVVDPDQLVRGPGDAARTAADGRRAAASDPHADGRADRDGDRSVRAPVAAD